MSNSDLNGKDKNIIDLADARKKQRTVHGGSRKKQSPSNNKLRFLIAGYSIWNWIQFILLLLLISYMFRSCSGGM
ncbi:MAG: hypothetical protein R3B45_05740 [Bdellovibrionota bacterium]